MQSLIQSLLGTHHLVPHFSFEKVLRQKYQNISMTEIAYIRTHCMGDSPLVTNTQNLSHGAWRQVALRFVDCGTSWVKTHGCGGKDPGRLVWML